LAEEVKLGRFAYTKDKPYGMKTKDGKRGFRVEYDEKIGAHINVFSGKEKETPHYPFDATEKTVKKIQKKFLR
jgi:hypothetical protein